MTSKLPNDKTDRQLKLFADAIEHLSQTFYNPDRDALSVALASYAAHSRLDFPVPVWVFLMGVAGSGKTAVISAAMEGLPATKTVSDVTPHCFISGLSEKLGGSSLLLNLPRIGQTTKTQGTLFFKDFTSILALNRDVRSEVFGALRQIYDGTYIPAKGVKMPPWHGKVTIVAAVTPRIERAWAAERDLGERFNVFRCVETDDPTKMSRAAMAQVRPMNGSDRRKQYSRAMKRFQEMIADFVDPPTLSDSTLHCTDEQEDQFNYLGQIAAKLRSHVHRDEKGRVEEPQFEAPTRLNQSMFSLAIGHAMLYRRDELTDADIQLGQRLGVDSIPPRRLQIIKLDPYLMSVGDIVEATGMYEHVARRACEDLEAIGALIEEKAGLYTISNRFEELKAQCPILQKSLPENVKPFPKASEAV